MAVKTPAARGSINREKRTAWVRDSFQWKKIRHLWIFTSFAYICILLHTLNTFISNSRPFSMTWSSNCWELMLGSLRTLIRVRARHCSPHWIPPTLQLGYPVKKPWEQQNMTRRDTFFKGWAFKQLCYLSK